MHLIEPVFLLRHTYIVAFMAARGVAYVYIWDRTVRRWDGYAVHFLFFALRTLLPLDFWHPLARALWTSLIPYWLICIKVASSHSRRVQYFFVLQQKEEGVLGA
ncbi:uncharacterized protein EI97DRAFT_48758 [Westerdykella ornata]|uniref:Uncharacterized protein n=1 Tax=Westerdykella ornata TaxID=318751 RepID=A0A6A6JHQ5_WESOR|nr:uncharacterized protein EI97DRAFT_48758 [Westerdykella ornata]KAF2276091.1 hypothetical protein EI97DRAFT_48758 [Westerdykella ornata]